MGIMTKHIERDRRTGRLSYRRVFPIELRPFVPSREIKRSLRAKTLSDPEAQRRLSAATAEYGRLEASARVRAAGNLPTLSEADVPFLAKSYTHRLQLSLSNTHFDLDDRDREWLAASAWRYVPLAFMDQEGSILSGRDEPWSNSERLREKLPELLSFWRTLLADGDRKGVLQAEGQSAEELLTEHGLNYDTQSEAFFRLCRVLLAQDMGTAGKLSRLLFEGIEFEPESAPERHPVSEGRIELEKGGQSLDALASDLLRQKTDPINRPTALIWQTALRLWREVYSDKGYSEVTRKDVSRWLDLVAEKPARLTRAQQALALPKLVEMYSGRTDVRRLAGKTLQQHLGALSSIWGKAQRRGLIERDDNPFQNHGIKVEKPRGGNALTEGELKAVFTLPVFTKHDRPKRGRGEAAYWIPLIALCTGGRPGEIAQLLREDFWEDAQGTWMMRYTDEGEHPILGSRRLKTSAHQSGKRTFPVPQPLLDLGLVDYLSWLEGEGKTAFFPKLTKTSKGLYDGWARWWGEYVRESGAIGKDKRQLRELRHNFPTAARSSGVSYEALAYLMGHKATGMTGRYGDLSPLGEEINKITDFGLDFAQVARWKRP